MLNKYKMRCWLFCNGNISLSPLLALLSDGTLWNVTEQTNVGENQIPNRLDREHDTYVDVINGILQFNY